MIELLTRISCRPFRAVLLFCPYQGLKPLAKSYYPFGISAPCPSGRDCSEDRVFCTLLYLNRFLLDLPITASVPLHRLEREVYGVRLQIFRNGGVPLEIVEEAIENAN